MSYTILQIELDGPRRLYHLTTHAVTIMQVLNLLGIKNALAFTGSKSDCMCHYKALIYEGQQATHFELLNKDFQKGTSKTSQSAFNIPERFAGWAIPDLYKAHEGFSYLRQDIESPKEVLGLMAKAVQHAPQGAWARKVAACQNEEWATMRSIDVRLAANPIPETL